MSSSHDNVPELPEWRPPPIVPPPKSCGPLGLTGCLVVLFLLLVGSSILVRRSADIFEWGFAISRTAIVEPLPEDYSQRDKERLERAFDGVIRRVRAGDLDRESLPKLSRAISDATRVASERKLTGEEAMTLMLRLEELVEAEPAPESSGREGAAAARLVPSAGDAA